MFYGTEENVESPFTLKLGPIVITVQELFVSAVSLAIVIPPSLLVVQIFRNVNVREKQMNRQKLLKDGNNTLQSKPEDGSSTNKSTKDEPTADIYDVESKQHVSFSDVVEVGQTSKNGIYRYSDYQDLTTESDLRENHRYKNDKSNVDKEYEESEYSDSDSEDDSDDDEETDDSEESEVEDDSEISESDEDDDDYSGDSDLWSEEESEWDDSDSDDDEEGTSQPKKKGLPAGCLCVGWTIAVLSIITPAFFVILYSMSWGPEISNSWLISYTLSFFESVLITDPIKVQYVKENYVFNTMGPGQDGRHFPGDIFKWIFFNEN